MSGGVERNQELKNKVVYVDGRSSEQRLADFMLRDNNMRNVIISHIIIGLIFPIILPLILISGLTFYMWWEMSINRILMPIRYPAWTKKFDPSSIEDNMPKTMTASGIEFIGVERKGATIHTSREIWCSDSDARTHRIYMGTTGAGKTESLLSMLYNPLCWGSGFSMTDGKAQIDVTARIFVMAWMFWREDDVLILNYMRGGQDRFKEMINKPKIGVRKSRVSNTWNPFSTANHETINQIIDSIMEKASGDGAQWQAKAINMKNALVQTIAFLRAKGDMLMSVSAIREMMSLDNMVKLAMRDDIPPAAAAAIRSYLSSGLPGFSWQLAKKGRPQASDTLLQHGYLTGQFTRTLGLMTDTYNDIFGDEIPEFDTQDVILNNRISFTMIPTLEKGVEEAGNLGKMQVASAKMMMSENLGYEIEGDFEDIVDNRQTNTDRPFYLVMDELGYYFAPGIDLMFAQGRSLQIALVAAGQDFQAMAKNNKNEVESMIANTRIKVSLKLEDPKETFEIFQKAAGDAQVAKLSGFEMGEASALQSVGQYRRTQNASIERVSRISLQELKKLGPGDGVMLYADKVIRFKSFNLFMRYKFDKKKVNIRINTFLPIQMAAIDKLQACSVPFKGEEEAPSASVARVIDGGAPTWKTQSIYPITSTAVFIALENASAVLAWKRNTNPADRGAYLYIKAIEAFRNNSEKPMPIDNEADNEIDHQSETIAIGSGIENGGKGLKKRKKEISKPAIVRHKTTLTDEQKLAMADNADNQDSEVWDTGATNATWETDFDNEVKNELKAAISAVSGMKKDVSALNFNENAMVDEEYEKIRHLAEENSKFEHAKEGMEEHPKPISTADDVLASFCGFDDLLK